MSGIVDSDRLDYYIYKPAHGVSAAFAVLFAISGSLHIWQNNLKYKSYRIGFLLPWAAFIFTAGLILREVSDELVEDFTIRIVFLSFYNTSNDSVCS